MDARVQDIKWYSQGELGWATLRVVGWDFTQVDYRERLLLSQETAERPAPVTNGGIVFEPRQCLCVNLAGSSLLAKQKSKKGQVPSMEQVQPVAMGMARVSSVSSLGTVLTPKLKTRQRATSPTQFWTRLAIMTVTVL